MIQIGKKEDCCGCNAFGDICPKDAITFTTDIEGFWYLTSAIYFDNKKVLYDTKDTSVFGKGYLNAGVYCRPSCYDCKFKQFPRIADITIGDCVIVGAGCVVSSHCPSFSLVAGNPAQVVDNDVHWKY